MILFQPFFRCQQMVSYLPFNILYYKNQSFINPFKIISFHSHTLSKPYCGCPQNGSILVVQQFTFSTQIVNQWFYNNLIFNPLLFINHIADVRNMVLTFIFNISILFSSISKFFLLQFPSHFQDHFADVGKMVQHLPFNVLHSTLKPLVNDFTIISFSIHYSF